MRKDDWKQFFVHDDTFVEDFADFDGGGWQKKKKKKKK